MMIGTVLGGISVERGVGDAVKRHFVQVRCGAALISALDPLGVEPGDRVLLTTGEGALSLCQEIPVDTAVIAQLK